MLSVTAIDGLRHSDSTPNIHDIPPPMPALFNAPFHIQQKCTHPLFGLILDFDVLTSRIYISNILRDSSFALHFQDTMSYHQLCLNFIGAYIHKINDLPISTMNDIDDILHHAPSHSDIMTFHISSNFIHSHASEIYLNDDRILPDDPSKTLDSYAERLQNFWCPSPVASFLHSLLVTISDIPCVTSMAHHHTTPDLIYHDIKSIPTIDGDVIAHLDDGSHVSTTNNKHIFFTYTAFDAHHPCNVRLVPADKIKYTPHGIGCVRVPANTPDGYITVPMYYTPELPTTIISNDSIARIFPIHTITGTTLVKNYLLNNFIFTLFKQHPPEDHIEIRGILIKGSCYTLPLLLPAPTDSLTPMSPHHMTMHQVTTSDPSMTRHLWHQRLNHCSDFYLNNAHLSIDGVPKFNPKCSILDVCPICIAAKMKQLPSNKKNVYNTSAPWEYIYMDCGFSGVRSKSDATNLRTYKGISGETCYLLIRDVHTGTLDGSCFISKAIPSSWLTHWLAQHICTAPIKRCVLDQGGELFHNKRFVQLLTSHGYTVLPTGAGAHHQAGFVERSHQSIGNGIRSLLTGANLPSLFWPYAFYHYIKICNMLPQRKNNKPSPSSYELLNHQKAPLTHLRTFGCRVWVKPPQKRPSKFQHNTRKGIFLGYLKHTNKNVYWYDVVSKRIKIAYHVRFDEGMNDLPSSELPPNVLHLQRIPDANLTFLEDQYDSSTDTLDFHPNGYFTAHDKHVKVTCTDKSYGFRFKTDYVTQRPFIHSILPNSSASSLCSSHHASLRKYLGSFVIAVNDIPIFDVPSIHQEFTKLRHGATTSFSMTLAPESKPTSLENKRALQEHLSDATSDDIPTHLMPSLSLGVDELRSIHTIRLHYLTPNDTHHGPTDDISDDMITHMIASINSSAATPEEKALKNYTRRNLKTLPNWDSWKQAEWRQLDRFHELSMYGQPCILPKGGIVVRLLWNYIVKDEDERRSRNCCDGSPRAAPRLHSLVNTYSSCIGIPIYRLYSALSTALGYTQYGGDARDAYAHSPPPSVPCFARIDDAYAEWYKARFDVVLDKNLVLPIQHALQGHPEAGVLWEHHINAILTGKPLHFTSTRHEPNIYVGKFSGKLILLCRQVDDFSIACDDPKIADAIYDIIGHALKLPGESTVPFVKQGVVSKYNGIDVLQSRDYTKLSCETYIEKLLVAHGWDTPHKSDGCVLSKHFEPLPQNLIPQLYTDVGPTEHTADHQKLEDCMQFAYQALLGELLYAFVISRPDIGYALVTMAKFASHPAKIHYQMLKRIALYLRQTKSWGIMYWRPHPLHHLPFIEHNIPPKDLSLPKVPSTTNPFQLCGFVDAAYANDLRKRRSTTGYAFILCGGVVAYKTQTQKLTATSSTEAEFYAAVTAAKVARYLRFILHELGFSQLDPTPIFEDNESTISMINSKKPTDRSRHIDIRYFAIQDWKSDDNIVMARVPGIVNPVDGLTKALGWMLHVRHNRQLMGHYGSVPSII